MFMSRLKTADSPLARDAQRSQICRRPWTNMRIWACISVLMWSWSGTACPKSESDDAYRIHTYHGALSWHICIRAGDIVLLILDKHFNTFPSKHLSIQLSYGQHAPVSLSSAPGSGLDRFGPPIGTGRPAKQSPCTGRLHLRVGGRPGTYRGTDAWIFRDASNTSSRTLPISRLR